ncbi:noggin-2-like [Terrapene carolina triunguis]|uniref:noggin-2-like n=1 Tax=Terrapene triunguis TaxID=2587831 RepID=UPI000CEF6CF6|nr:noggin-2-like [Terrapene carolina triunguis]
MKGPQTLLLWAGWLLLQRGSGQPYLRLRPSPSDNLPVKDILEHPDPEYDPKEQDLDERTLRKKLGSSFDPAFMSVAAPAPGNLSSPAPPPRLRGSAPLPGELKKLELGESPLGPRMKLGKKARRKFLQWLWAYTHCPVRYTWKDLGVRFWPRYIKEGSCFAEKSCSFPEGMYCKPAKSVPKTFLRWYCQGWSRQKYCTWIPVQYPLISECKCSC